MYTYSRAVDWDAYLVSAAGARPATKLMGYAFSSKVASDYDTRTVLERTPVVDPDAPGLTIADFGPDFDWALAPQAWAAELVQPRLSDILVPVWEPLSPERRRVRERADYSFRNGFRDGAWFSDALRDYRDAAQDAYEDFAVHQGLGMLYLWCQPAAKLDKARQAYQRAARYAAPCSPYYEALARLHLAFTAYLQRKDAAAVKEAGYAAALLPDLPELSYAHAKFAAAAGQGAEAVEALASAIRRDRDYAIKAGADPDFAPLEAEIGDMIDRLRAEARAQAEADQQALLSELSGCDLAPTDREKLKPGLDKIRARLLEDTLFGYLDASEAVGEARQVMASLCLSKRDALRKEAQALWNDLWVKLADNVIPDKERDRLKDALKAVRGKLVGVVTLEEAEAAYGSVAAARDRWEEAVNQATLLQEHTGPVVDLAFSSDGKVLASASSDETVWLWDTATGRPLSRRLMHGGLVYRVAFSPDDTLLATCSGDRLVRLWEVPSGASVEPVLAGHGAEVTNVLFSPDGRTLASASNDRTIRIWDVKTHEQIVVMTKGHTEPVTGIAFSPDGNLLASCSSDTTVRLWRTSTGWPLHKLCGHTEPVREVAFSPDGQVLASAGYDNSVRLWSVRTGEELLVLAGHRKMVRYIAFSPDGEVLASGSDDRTVRLWEVPTGRAMAVLAGHTDRIGGVAFSPDGQWLATGSDDKTVRLWAITRSKAQWQAQEAERRRLEAEKQRRQVEAWKAGGRCERCGAHLSRLDKLLYGGLCREHWQEAYAAHQAQNPPPVCAVCKKPLRWLPRALGLKQCLRHAWEGTPVDIGRKPGERDDDMDERDLIYL